MSARHRILVTLSIGLVAGAAGRPARAWTTDTAVRMAEHAVRVAPPHLVGQIERHEKQLVAGVRAAANSDPSRGPDDSFTAVEVALEPIIESEVQRAARRIEEHEPFSHIVFQMGVVAYWVAALNDPLISTTSASERPVHLLDYQQYIDIVSSRFSVLYYPYGRQIDSPAGLASLLERARRRGRLLAPAIAAEYRRIGVVNGRRYFDDKSTAFGVGALAYSHGVSDIAGVLRYIWLAAGGADTLRLPSLDADHLILISSGSEDR